MVCKSSSTEAPASVRLPTRSTVTLVHGVRVQEIDVKRLRASRVQGLLTVRLDALWLDAGLPGDLCDLGFDFVGEGGFRASRNAMKPLPGELLAKCYLITRTRDLMWEPGVVVEPAYKVKGVTMIVAGPA